MRIITNYYLLLLQFKKLYLILSCFVLFSTLIKAEKINGKPLNNNKNINKVQKMINKTFNSQNMPKVQDRKIRQISKSKFIQHQYWSQAQHRKNQFCEQDAKFDHLDLIFRNQSKEIQGKLVKLLIKYNATMEYNKNSDMFEVDLLIPFSNEGQKKQFISQFLEIRRQKNQEIKGIKENGSQIVQQNNLRNFSFNNRQNYQDYNFYQQERKDSDIWINDLEQMKNNLSYNKNDQQLHNQQTKQTGQFNQITLVESIRQNPVNFDRLDEVIARRLSNAVYIIKNKQEHKTDNVTNDEKYNHIDIPQSQSHIIENFKSNETIKEESIIDQIENNFSMNGTEKLSDIIYLNNSSIKRQNELFYQPSHSNYKDSNYSYRDNQIGNDNIGNEHNFIKIAEEPQEDQNQPIYYEKKGASKNVREQGKIISFQDFSKKYQSIKYQQISKNKPLPKKNSNSDAKLNHIQVNSKRITKERFDPYARKK